jgi:hypothetical protein
MFSFIHAYKLGNVLVFRCLVTHLHRCFFFAQFPVKNTEFYVCVINKKN